MSTAAVDWPKLRALALSLDLPEIVESTSWGQPNLKAFGKLWVWWSPHEDCPVFKVDFDEREHLLEHRADTFFITPHYRNHRLVLMRRDGFDADWIRINLARVWRAQAPRRFLKAWDARHGPDPGG